VIILALDTALNATSVAVLDGERVLASVSHPMERGHQERLAGIVRDAMAEAGVGFSALHRIGVTVGPGSFTGLRVGLAFAKGLGLALAIPLVGVGTLEALAAGAAAPGLVAAVIDARRGQVYLQIFNRGQAVTPPEALSLEAAQDRIAAHGADSLTLVGSGAALLHAADGTVSPQSLIDPVALARLTAEAREPLSRPAPLYLRAPDAKTIAERAASQ
jgi:tRNA threonylcarbamoyladenosine biosynthesis protein TsaB